MLLRESLYIIPSNLKEHFPIWSPAIKDKSKGRGSGGLLCLIEKDYNPEILESTNWWIFFRIQMYTRHVIIGSFYCKPTEKLEPWLDILQQTIHELRQNYPDDAIILGGDFNSQIAELGDDLPEELVDNTQVNRSRRTMVTKTDNRGMLLLDFMIGNGFTLLNGRTKSDTPGKFTSTAGVSTYDLIWISVEDLDMVSDVLVSSELLGSNHLAIQLELLNNSSGTVSQNSMSSQQPVIQNQVTPGTANPRIVWKEQFSSEFTQEMSNKYSYRACLPNDSVDKLNSILVNSISEVAKTVKMTSSLRHTHHNSMRPKHPWFDEECMALRKEIKSLYARIGRNPSSLTERELFNEKNKCFKKLTVAKKQKYKQVNIDKFANVKNPIEYWDTVRRSRGRAEKVDVIPRNDWSKFIRSIYPPRSSESPLLLPTSDPELDKPITLEELDFCIKRAKTGKSPGCDNISNNFYKSLPMSWKLHMLNLFNRVFELAQVPADWTSVILCMLYKKGDKSDPLNYRGIALVNCVTKLFTDILNVRAYKWAERLKLIPEVQAGFRIFRGVLDNIYSLQSIIHNRLRLQGGKLYALFVDYRRAFDSVPHNSLWTKLGRLGLSSKYINILQSLYERATVQIRTSQGLSDTAEISEGVLQGEKLSPLLFNLYLSDITTFFDEQGIQGVDIDDRTKINLLLYADDLVLLANGAADLKRKMKCLEAYCRLNGLTINISKTKIMVFRRGGPLPAAYHNFSLNDKPVEIVPNFTYLGVKFAPTAGGLAASTTNVLKAKVASASVIRTCSKIGADSWSGILRMYHSVVVPTLTYTAAIWSLRHLDLMETAQANFVKSLFYLPRSAPGYIIRLETGLVKIRCLILIQALKWISKMLTMENSRLPLICLRRQISLSTTGALSAASRSKVSRYNWIQQIKNGLGDLNCEDLWENLTSDWWNQRIPEIQIQLREQSRWDDYRRYLSTTSLLLRTSRLPADEYLCFYPERCSLTFVRTKMQLRLATMHTRHFFIEGISYNINPTQLCTMCLMQVPEDLTHILLVCPFYEPLRRHYMHSYSLGPSDSAWSGLAAFLNNNDSKDLLRLHCYTKKCLQLRSQELND